MDQHGQKYKSNEWVYCSYGEYLDKNGKRFELVAYKTKKKHKKMAQLKRDGVKDIEITQDAEVISNLRRV